MVALPAVDRAALVTAYLNACEAADQSGIAVREAAFALVTGITNYEAFTTLRDDLKAAHIQRRLAAGSSDVAAKDAANMLWSRTVARAKEGSGVASKKDGKTIYNWEPPKAPISDESKAKAAQREAKRSEKRSKLIAEALRNGATQKTAEALADLALDGRKSAKTPDAVVPEGVSPEMVALATEIDANDDLFNAVESVVAFLRDNPSARGMLLAKWIEANTKATTTRKTA